MRTQSRILLVLTAFAVFSVAPFAQSQKASSPTKHTTFRGCLQGDHNKGFGLLTPTVTTGGGPGLMRTYRVEPAKNAELGVKNELGELVNKMVEITGTLSTEPSERGHIPVPDAQGGRQVVDSGQSVPTTPEQGQQTWSDGTLTAVKIKQVENSCAAGERSK